MNTAKALLLTLLVLCLPARAGHDPVFQPVMDVFSGLTAFDYDRMRAAVTDDFLLLEHGEVWTIQTLIDAVPPSKAVRRNFFSEISRHSTEDMVLINYWNKAIITFGSEVTKLVWLESVVLVKTDEGWKMQQMHSTRLDPENHPKDIDFIEVK